jgi:hypothetical protein
MRRQKRLYRVEALLVTVGCYGGNFVVAEEKQEAIEKCRQRYKHYAIAGYKATSLGVIMGDIL